MTGMPQRCHRCRPRGQTRTACLSAKRPLGARFIREALAAAVALLANAVHLNGLRSAAHAGRAIAAVDSADAAAIGAADVFHAPHKAGALAHWAISKRHS